jgi:hypothetical protein
MRAACISEIGAVLGEGQARHHGRRWFSTHFRNLHGNHGCNMTAYNLRCRIIGGHPTILIVVEKREK